MSDEEKKAIEWLKKADWFSARLYSSTILNLIEKQQKEIEELKEENKKYIVQLTDEQYRKLVDIIRDEISKAWKDKIKAKIEEIKKTHNGDDFNLTNVIMILQSLLEKE